MEDSIAPKQLSRRGPVNQPLYDWPAGDQAIDDYDNRDNQQYMNQTATHMHYEEPETPKNEEYYRDRPKHYGILARSELRLA